MGLFRRKPPKREPLYHHDRSIARIRYGLEKIPTHFTRNRNGSRDFFVNKTKFASKKRPVVETVIHLNPNNTVAERHAADLQKRLDLGSRPHFVAKKGGRARFYDMVGKPLGGMDAGEYDALRKNAELEDADTQVG